jgi:hypothetical protein
MVGAEQPLLDVRVREPVFDAIAAKDLVDAAAIVAGSSVLLCLPACVHPKSVRVECQAEIPEDRLFQPLISFPYHPAAEYQLIEEAARRRRNELIDSHVFYSERFFDASGVELGPYYV